MISDGILEVPLETEPTSVRHGVISSMMSKNIWPTVKSVLEPRRWRGNVAISPRLLSGQHRGLETLPRGQDNLTY